MPIPEAWSCADVFRRLDDYLDRELAPDEIERVREHVDVCAACADEFRFEASMIRHLRDKLRRVALPADFTAGVWRRLAAARDSEAKNGS